MTSCNICGMRADLDPLFHQERYGHWPRTERGGMTRLQEDELASNELYQEWMDRDEIRIGDLIYQEDSEYDQDN